LAVATFAEEARETVRGLVADDGRWRHPIVINLVLPSTTEPERSPAALRLLATEEGPKLQIDIVLAGDLARARFPQLVVRALLIEWGMRDVEEIAAGSSFRSPPDWLVEGVVRWMQMADRAEAAEIYRAILASGSPMPLREFLGQRAERLDAASERLYGALAYSLLNLLVDLPEGRRALGAYARGPDEGDPVVALASRFPALGATAGSAEKWWTLGIAKLGAADRYRGMSLAETDAALGALLRVTVSSPDGPKEVGLAELAERKIDRPTRELLAARDREMLALEARAHALMRPVIAEVRAAQGLLARGKPKGVAERLAAAEEMRGRTVERMEQVGDYLNWYEATQVGVRSGAFDRYIEAANALEKPRDARDDAIGRYLDTLERALE
jgi:hypothetical protein